MTDEQELSIRDLARAHQRHAGGLVPANDAYAQDVPLLLAALDEARKTIAGLCERVVAQSELLSRRAEKPTPGRARLLGISGRKGSGKSTLARLLQQTPALGRVEVRPLAAPLKALCVDLLGLPPEAVYGDDEAKNAPTSIRWNQMPGAYSGWTNGEPMTVREVLQQVGTEVFRRMAPGCWINSLLADASRSTADLIVVDDVRFRDEAEAIQRTGGMVVRLLRGERTDDQHASENDLSTWDGWGLVMADGWTAEETAERLVAHLELGGWTARRAT